MTEEERWKYINQLDNELLKGGVILSDWCTLIIQETDSAFGAGAPLATILTAVAGIETYLRAEYSEHRNEKLYDLTNNSPIEEELKNAIHILRRYRNRWVHVDDPWDEQKLLDQFERDLEKMASLAVKTLRQVIYENQFV